VHHVGSNYTNNSRFTVHEIKNYHYSLRDNTEECSSLLIDAVIHRILKQRIQNSTL